MSISGGPSRSVDKNLSNNKPNETASALVMPSAKHTALLAALPRPWQKIFERSQNCTMSQTTKKYPAKLSFSIIASSWSTVRQALDLSERSSSCVVGLAPYLRVAPCSANNRKYETSFNPSGHSNGGSFGATSDKSNADDFAISAVSSTTPGYLANRRSCSAPLRMYALGAGGNCKSISSRLARCRTAASATANRYSRNDA